MGLPEHSRRLEEATLSVLREIGSRAESVAQRKHELGMLAQGDVVIALSNSGHSEEILQAL